MNPRLLIIIVPAAILAVGAGAMIWIRIHPPAAVPEAQTAPSSKSEELDRRDRFFGGDPDRDVRGGQEMKPRW